MKYKQEFTKQSTVRHRTYLAKDRHMQGHMSVQRARSSWMWPKVGDQVRQGLAGYSQELELNSQHSRRLLEGFQQVSLMSCVSFRKSYVWTVG